MHKNSHAGDAGDLGPTGSRDGSISLLLDAWVQGDRGALDALVAAIYRELRVIAGRQLAKERTDHTLQTTELLNEAYLRLVRNPPRHVHHRSHFLALCAGVMRRILVDHARSRGYQKRGGAALRIPLDDVVVLSPQRAVEIVRVDEALSDLARRDRRRATVVELRYFAGLTIDEIAEVLKLAPITVKRDWTAAKAWLHRYMQRQDSGGEGERD